MTPTEDHRPPYERVYAPGREPGGRLRWEQSPSRVTERRERARALWARVHPRPKAPPISLVLFTPKPCEVCGEPRKRGVRFCSTTCAAPVLAEEKRARHRQGRPVPTVAEIVTEMRAALRQAAGALRADEGPGGPEVPTRPESASTHRVHARTQALRPSDTEETR